MKKPVIGITPNYKIYEDNYSLAANYTKSILAAGGLPLILPLTNNKKIIKEYLNVLDGILLSGGGDIDPLIYGQEPIVGMGDLNPERDYFEIELLKLANDACLSILGICKGCQLINIALGGTVYQDLYQENITKIKHNQEAPRWYPTHHINLVEDSHLQKIIKKKRSQVNSIHHQAINKPAPGFRVAARADDGVIEAIEKNGNHFVIGIQWHPETMSGSRDSLLVFDKFIKSSRKKGKYE